MLMNAGEIKCSPVHTLNMYIQQPQIILEGLSDKMSDRDEHISNIVYLGKTSAIFKIFNIFFYLFLGVGRQVSKIRRGGHD